MLITGLVALILGQSNIAAVIGDRLQPAPAGPDFSHTQMSFQVVSDISEDANDGPVGVAVARVVFDCFAQRYLDARSLAMMLKALLHGYVGTLSDGTVVQLAEAANLVDRFDDGSRVYCTSFHALITYGD